MPSIQSSNLTNITDKNSHLYIGISHKKDDKAKKGRTNKTALNLSGIIPMRTKSKPLKLLGKNFAEMSIARDGGGRGTRGDDF